MDEKSPENEAAFYDELASNIESDAQNEERSADTLEQYIAVKASDENAAKTHAVVSSFLASYKHKEPDTSNVRWLETEFEKYPSLWKSPAERKETAREIVDTVEHYEAEKLKLAENAQKGLPRESYIAKAIETGAKANGVTDFGKYASEIDRTIAQANTENIKMMYRMDGGINQQYHLDGFIAEQHHADTFNIEAAAQGSPYRAEVLKPAPGERYAKNSVDIVIRDTRTGKIVRRYQSKYGSDAEATQSLFDNGDYRGQRKLVPKGQSKDVEGSTEVIEHEGVKSKPLSKEEAKERQQKIQQEAEAKQYEWNEVNRSAIAKNIGKKAGVSALLAVGFQGARILGRRIWNALSGQENQSVEEDAREFAESALESGVSAGLTVAATGGVTVAIKNGWLGPVLRSTPVGMIANAVCVGIENVKVLAEFATGKITGEEALNKAGDATCSLVGSLALGAEGASVGAAIGTVFGPVGTAIGGIAGGIVGGIAGSTIGHAIWEGGKKIVQTVGRVIRGIGEGIANVVSGIADGIGNFISSAGDFFSSLFW
jgi:hypothetical protein